MLTPVTAKRLQDAYRVVSAVIGLLKLAAVVKPGSVYQPLKIMPAAVGAGGCVAVVPVTTSCVGTATPWPFMSKVTVDSSAASQRTTITPEAPG
jgi:hypothetical protein